MVFISVAIPRYKAKVKNATIITIKIQILC